MPTFCTNVHCDVKSISVILEDGSLFSAYAPGLGASQGYLLHSDEDPQRNYDLWRFIGESAGGSNEESGIWDEFIQRAKSNYLIISSIPFLDVWNVETERLKGSCIHNITPDGRLIPFCPYNINGVRGNTLYR